MFVLSGILTVISLGSSESIAFHKGAKIRIKPEQTVLLLPFILHWNTGLSIEQTLASH